MLRMQGAPKISKKTKAEAQGLSEAEQIAMQVIRRQQQHQRCAEQRVDVRNLVHVIQLATFRRYNKGCSVQDRMFAEARARSGL